MSTKAGDVANGTVLAPHKQSPGVQQHQDKQGAGETALMVGIAYCPSGTEHPCWVTHNHL